MVQTTQVRIEFSHVRAQKESILTNERNQTKLNIEETNKCRLLTAMHMHTINWFERNYHLIKRYDNFQLRLQAYTPQIH